MLKVLGGLGCPEASASSQSFSPFQATATPFSPDPIFPWAPEAFWPSGNAPAGRLPHHFRRRSLDFFASVIRGHFRDFTFSSFRDAALR